MGLAENFASDRRQHLIGVVVQDVEGEVAEDALQGAGPDQPAGAAGVQGMLDGVGRPSLEQVARASARRACLSGPSRLPNVGDVP